MRPVTLDPDMDQLLTDWPLAAHLDLAEGATVIVAGAYEGKAIQLLKDLYPGIMVYGFDPQAWAIAAARERLEAKASDDGWALFDFALGVGDGNQVMSEWHTDAASFIEMGREPRDAGHGRLREFGKVMLELEIETIDLAVFNMEGYEYLLLPHLQQTGWLNAIRRLAIQWHVHAGDARDESRLTIDRLLAQLQQSTPGTTAAPLGIDPFVLKIDERPTWTYLVREASND